MLDGEERRRLVELLASGCSRRVAAMQIGCEANAITRTAEGDRMFAAEVIRAESNLEGKLLGSVRRAAEPTATGEPQPGCWSEGIRWTKPHEGPRRLHASR